MDKFILAENPMSGNTLAIVHMMQPISVILVDEGHVTTKWPHEHLTFTNADKEQEAYTLSLYHCFTTSFDGEDHARTTNKLFRDAWHWYMAYMNWEDKQITDHEED